MKYLLLLIFAISVNGCLNKPSIPMRISSTNTISTIQKGAMFPAINGAEVTPVVFNGDLLYISTQNDDVGHHVRIVRESDATVLSDQLLPYEFVSGIVSNGVLYVYGATDSRTTISVESTADLTNWTPSQVVYTAPTGTNVFNTSVSPDATGFTMAYEICNDKIICFNSRFMH